MTEREVTAGIVDGTVAVAAQWPTAGPRRGSLAAAVLLSSVLTGGVLALLLARNHQYFFVDDRVAETVPKLLDIGRLVRSGEAPWLTTSFINGGGYAVDYLNGVFNPLNVALAVVMTTFDDVALASFAYVLVHCVLLAASAAWLARSLGLGTWWSTAIAVSCGVQPYTVLWNATAWSQGLLAFSWFVLAVAAAVSFHLCPRRRTGLLLLVGTFGCLTSGWPLAVFLLAFTIAALLLSELLAGVPRRRVAWLAAWGLGGAVCSLVALLPLLTAFQVASRRTTTGNEGNFLVTPLEALLHFANPAYYGFFSSFGGDRLQDLPHFYVAWFALPVIVMLRWSSLPRHVAPLLHTGLAGLMVSVLLALGPERISVFRFPMRAVQFTGFFLLFVVAVAVAHGRFSFSRRRLHVLLALVALLVVNTVQVDPVGKRRAVAFGLVLGAVCLAVWLLGRRAALQPVLARRALDGLVVVCTVGVLIALAVLHPMGRGGDIGFPHEVAGLRPVSGQDYTLFYGTYPSRENTVPAFYEEYRPATMGVIVGDRQVNGYSSVGNRYLRQFLDIDDQGNFSGGAAARFTGVEPTSGRPVLELLRVDQVIALRGEYDDELRPLLTGQGWLREERRYTAVYRHATYVLPGLVSHVSPGTEVTPGGCRRTASSECVIVRGGNQDGSVVFARLWLPGYRATISGRAVKVRRQADTLVSVAVPAGAEGELRLSYVPPGFGPAVLLAALMLGGLGLASWRYWGLGRETESGTDAVPTASSAQHEVHGDDEAG